jgi:drug/metabolite transporter (DMT)-like permease
VDDLEGLLLGLTAALAWGLTDTIATFASRRVGSLRATAGTQLTSVVVLTVLLVGTGAPLPADPVVTATALACGAVAALAYLSFFTALRHGPITVVSPVVATYGGLTVVLSVLLLGESLGGAQALGVAVATAGILLASIVFKGSIRSVRPVGPGVAYAVVALVAFAVLTVALSGPIRAAGWLPILLLARIANAGMVWLILGATRWRRPPAPASVEGRPVDRRALALVVAAGLLDIGGFIAFAVGLEIAPTWLIGITSSFGPVIAVAAGVLLFAERPRPVQWVGLGLVALSLFLIALG